VEVEPAYTPRPLTGISGVVVFAVGVAVDDGGDSPVVTVIGENAQQKGVAMAAMVTMHLACGVHSREIGG
jgi:hypothetical protein